MIRNVDVIATIEAWEAEHPELHVRVKAAVRQLCDRITCEVVRQLDEQDGDEYGEGDDWCDALAFPMSNASRPQSRTGCPEMDAQLDALDAEIRRSVFDAINPRIKLDPGVLSDHVKLTITEVPTLGRPSFGKAMLLSERAAHFEPLPVDYTPPEFRPGFDLGECIREVFDQHTHAIGSEVTEHPMILTGEQAKAILDAPYPPMQAAALPAPTPGGKFSPGANCPEMTCGECPRCRRYKGEL